MMVLAYYDKLGDHDEYSLAQLRSNGLTPEDVYKRQDYG